MPFHITVHHGPTYLLVVGTGDARLCDLVGLVDMAASIARLKTYTRILFDFLAVDAQLSSADQAELVFHAAEALQGMERVASVVASDSCASVAASEEVARQRGLHLRSFSVLLAATEWLSQREG